MDDLNALLQQLNDTDSAYTAASQVQSPDAVQLHAHATQLATQIHALQNPIEAPHPPISLPDPAAQKDPSAGGGMLNIAGYQTNIHTPESVDRFLAGAGENLTNTYRGIKQLVGAQSAQDTDDQRALDAPLNHTTAGMMGNIAGGAAQFALPAAGAAKLLGYAGKAAPFIAALAPELGGAAIGATQPVGSDESRAENAGIGAVSAGVGKQIGTSAETLLRSGKDMIPAATRAAYALANKYKIPLTVPQLSDNTALKHYTNLTDALPFSGADARYRLQRAAFNNAVGAEAGVVNPEGAVTPDKLDTAQNTVGKVIGDIAARNDATPNTQNVAGLMGVLNDTRANSTPEVQDAVEHRLRQIFAHVDPVTGVIPGTAWRQANTSLGRQIRSTTDGDTRHYLGQVQEHFMDMMQNNMSQADQGAWREARGQYRNIMSIAPLVEKGGNEGISPALLRQRLIAAKNNRGDLSDLADLGQEQLKQRVPNSGTAQKNMLGGIMGLGAGSGYFFGHTPETIGTSIGLGALNVGANRALNSQLATKYYMGRLPDALARYANPTLESLGMGTAAASEPTHQDATDVLDHAAHSGALASKPDSYNGLMP